MPLIPFVHHKGHEIYEEAAHSAVKKTIMLFFVSFVRFMVEIGYHEEHEDLEVIALCAKKLLSLFFVSSVRFMVDIIYHEGHEAHEGSKDETFQTILQ